MITLHQINLTDTAMLQRIMQIHDEVPRAWDPTHRAPQVYLDRQIERMQSGDKPRGVWVLCTGEACLPDAVIGVLWASIEDSLGTPVCSIGSLWVHPEHRHASLVPMLSNACVQWAQGLGAKRLDTCTHTTNLRMREILEKHGFAQGMVNYSRPLELA